MRSATVIALAAIALQTWRCDAQELARQARFTVDNDYFNFWLPPRERPDRDYTQATKISWDRNGLPSYMKSLACRKRLTCGTTIEIGQEMYTPTIDAAEPIPGQRAYAGLLYARFAAHGASEHSSRTLALTAGLTGLGSLAEPAQVIFHRTFGFRKPLGWKHQLGGEPTLALNAEQRWRVVPASRYIDIVPIAGVNAGTLRTSAYASGRFRIGTDLDHPWLASRFRNKVAMQAFIGGRVEAVGRDLFLDGSTFEKAIRVDKKAIVARWDRGARLRIGKGAVEYDVFTVSREYKSGPPRHTYGSISVSWTLNSPLR